jgi:hypothetical protein
LKNEELRQKTWVGVVPTWTAYGDVVPNPENRVEKVSFVDCICFVLGRKRGERWMKADMSDRFQNILRIL